jgi:hypothetical protein
VAEREATTGRGGGGALSNRRTCSGEQRDDNFAALEGAATLLPSREEEWAGGQRLEVINEERNGMGLLVPFSWVTLSRN